MQTLLWPGVTVLLLVLGTALLSADASLPEGRGLSAKYPGDKGIAGDPAVLFADSFEQSSVEQVKQHWGGEPEDKEGKVLSLSTDAPAGSHGKQSLQMTVTQGQNATGYLYTQLPRAVDTAFLRLYVKYDSQHFAYHCGLHFGAYKPLTFYAQGDPGRPRGDDTMQIELMPIGTYGSATPPQWTVACFWPDMKASADGSYAGNGISPARPVPVGLDRWQCVEMMMKSNSAPDKYDGELALWVDGKLQMHVKEGTPHGPWTGMGFDVADRDGEPFEGFRWRTDTSLKINFLWLLYNVMEYNPASPVTYVWFDDVVVSTEYIGPIAP